MEFGQWPANHSHPASNWKGAHEPDSADDSDAGFEVGSLWITTASQKVWICVDATAAKAVWKKIG